MEIKRDLYLNKLIRHMHNGMIKVITGIRRSGKSYLLFKLFYDYLISINVNEDHIIKIALDDRINKKYRDPDELYSFVKNSIKDNDMYYILLDEVQMVPEFEDVLNGFLHISNVDAYVTGSNAKFLSKDIITEFRGRGDQIHIHPLSYSEFKSVFDGSDIAAYNQYSIFGGLPKILSFDIEEDKINYLKNIFIETYIKDIKERNDIRNDEELDILLDILSSSIGSLTNPKKLADTFNSVIQSKISPNTISRYIEFFCDSFLIEEAKRYDIKGKKYISTPSKYYFTDLGLRNARLNFRQNEETHILENIIYNELCIRGFNVDVGIVPSRITNENGERVSIQHEVDFVCNFGDKRYYIQVAHSIPTAAKLQQEQQSLLKISDNFKKIIIVKELARTHYNDEGILMLKLFDFLQNPESINN